MTPEEATKTSFDPFDVTKVWPRGESFFCHLGKTAQADN
jgi:catalase